MNILLGVSLVAVEDAFLTNLSSSSLRLRPGRHRTCARALGHMFQVLAYYLDRHVQLILLTEKPHVPDASLQLPLL